MKKHLKLCVALIVVAAILMSLGFFLLYWFFGDKYEDFENFNEEFDIPGLDDGFIPQGMGNYSSDNVFLVSGYMNDGSASRVYVVQDSETVGYVTVTLSDDSTYTGHGSGIATNGSKVWLCSESTVYRLDYKIDDFVTAAKTNSSVTVSSSFDAYCDASFCYYGTIGTGSTGYLYVGEFYRKGNYETAEEHRLTTNAGDENTAVILRFSASSTSTTLQPTAAYSITGKIQGMAVTVTDDSVVYVTLSQSYGLANSHLLTYKYSSSESHSVTYYNSDRSDYKSNVTTYVFDSSNLVNDYEIPSMSEGLCTVKNKIYVLFESAGAKYKMFVRERLSNVYSVRLDEKKFSV